MRNCIKTEIKDDVEVVKEEVEIMSDTDSSDGVGVMSDSVSDREMSEEDKTVGDDMLGTKLKIIIVKVNLDRILKAVLIFKEMMMVVGCQPDIFPTLCVKKRTA